MKLSVVIITRNRSDKLQRLLLSLAANTVMPNEIIIIDNDSSDNTSAVVQHFAVEYPKITINLFVEQQVGISYARNRGLQEARSEIIAFIDDDCVADRLWVAQIIMLHNEHPDVAAIGGNTLNFAVNTISYCGHLFRKYATFGSILNRVLDVKNIDRLLSRPQMMSSLSTQNISYKKELLGDISFDPEICITESVDLSWRLYHRDKNPVMYQPNMIVYHEYRDHLSDFLRLNFKYGKSSAVMEKKAFKFNYYPDNVLHLPSFLYLKFCYAQLWQKDVGPIKRILIVLLLLARRVFFLLGYYSQKGFH